MTYPAFPKIPRFNRTVIISEKIDGTNGQIAIWSDENDIPDDVVAHQVGERHYIAAGSRNRWLSPEKDNAGFNRWVYSNAEALVETLGEGTHFGEWWGQGIQRNYGLTEKRFSLFNTHRWGGLDANDYGLHVVPELYIQTGSNISHAVDHALNELRERGSVAAPGFMNPEGIIIYHTAAGQYFKATLVDDESPKSAVA